MKCSGIICKLSPRAVKTAKSESKKFEKNRKEFLTKRKRCANIWKLSDEWRKPGGLQSQLKIRLESFKKVFRNLKKVLDKRKEL